MTAKLTLLMCVASAVLTGSFESARADKISHPIAVFTGLDKITGRIRSFEVAINETVQFGSLQITPHVCFTKPVTEAPRTDVFVEVDEADEEKKTKRIFGGWMFADSPGLHGIEHPIFDVWLTDCKGGTQVIKEAPPPDVAELPPDAAEAPPTDPNKPAPAPKKPKPKPKPVAAAAQEPAPAGPAAPLDLGGGNTIPQPRSGR